VSTSKPFAPLSRTSQSVNTPQAPRASAMPLPRARRTRICVAVTTPSVPTSTPSPVASWISVSWRRTSPSPAMIPAPRSSADCSSRLEPPLRATAPVNRASRTVARAAPRSSRATAGPTSTATSVPSRVAPSATTIPDPVSIEACSRWMTAEPAPPTTARDSVVSRTVRPSKRGALAPFTVRPTGAPTTAQSTNVGRALPVTCVAVCPTASKVHRSNRGAAPSATCAACSAAPSNRESLTTTSMSPRRKRSTLPLSRTVSCRIRAQPCCSTTTAGLPARRTSPCSTVSRAAPLTQMPLAPAPSITHLRSVSMPWSATTTPEVATSAISVSSTVLGCGEVTTTPAPAELRTSHPRRANEPCNRASRVVQDAPVIRQRSSATSPEYTSTAASVESPLDRSMPWNWTPPPCTTRTLPSSTCTSTGPSPAALIVTWVPTTSFSAYRPG